jgi:hypothetical protein
MLRVRWCRQGPPILIVEGIIDPDHGEVLSIAGAAAVNGSEWLQLDLRKAVIDPHGAEALEAMKRTVWTLCGARVFEAPADHDEPSTRVA